MIRLRRVPARPWRRPRYEIERVDRQTGRRERLLTGVPETEIDKDVGVAEASVIIAAANAAWRVRDGGWIVDFPENEPAFRALDDQELDDPETP